MKTKRSSVALHLWSFFLTLLFNLNLSAQCPTPPGNPALYGSGSWRAYVYSYTDTGNPPANPFATYRGFFTLPETFNNDLASGSIAGPNICGTYSDTFAIRMRMQRTFTPGNYTFTVGGDDGYRLSLDGGATFIINNWSDRSYGTTTSAVVYLDGPVNIVLEYYEKFGLSRVSYSFNTCASSTAPTAINAPTALCQNAGGTTLVAQGGTHGSGAVFQWGTGAVGTNIITTTTGNALYVNPTATTTYWVRRIDPAPCAVVTSGVSTTITVNTPSTIPTTISGTTTICAGQSTTLTVSGGTHGTGAVYEWGTGYNAGVNVIAGATGSSITVSPTSQTGYWVRRIDPAPCPANNSGHITTTVTVNPSSTAPTTITPSATAICPGNSVTLTASGGTALSGSTFQWGTGTTIGSNVISGQTGASITVSPNTTTTYWVRRFDPSCNAFTAGITFTLPTAVAPGNPALFGANTWNVYGYSGADVNLGTTTYLGFYTTNTLNFNTQTGTNSWANNTSPSSASGWNGCPVPADSHTFTAKRRGFPCGNYTVAMQNWDDVAQLYINNTLVWSANSWSGNGNFNVIVGTYYLDSTSTVEIRNRENGGLSNISVTFTNTNIPSTAPTAITGITVLCEGTSTTLTATGGTMGTTGAFQWGTGTTVGANIIAGATSASLTVTPTTTTTYWVRRVDSICWVTTAAVTTTVTVNATTVAGNLSSPTTTICKNTAVSEITLTGNTGAVIKWQYAADAAFTSGVTDIAVTNTSLSAAQIGTFASTRYFRAVVQNGNCLVVNTAPLAIVVPDTVVFNGTWSGTPTDKTPILIASNYTLTSDLEACSCQIAANATLTIPAGRTLRTQQEIEVSTTGGLIVENNGSLVQVNDAAINSGSITFKRNTTPLKQFDYTYFSSPIQNTTLGQLAPQSMFYSFNPTINNWNLENVNTVMTSGRGYIFRAPNTLNFNTPQIFGVSLNGTPTNGIVSTTIVKGTGTTFNLIGNPYPSAIDIDAFLMDPTNDSIVNGTIYLWTHNTAIANVSGTNIYVYTSDDYAKYNLTGGVQTADPAITGGTTPNGRIASGQGFFIEANDALPAGTYTARFNNSMRIMGENNQFFRTSGVTTQSTVLNKHRVWLSLSNAQGAYSELLVGYITGATQGMDSKYDGRTLPAGNVVSFYSLLNATELAIQGRALPFHDNDRVPLGFQSTLTGTFQIRLSNFDGLFQNQNVYLYDTTTQTYHDLKAGAFSFTITQAGTNNNRFELRFTDGNALDTGTFTPDNTVMAFIKEGMLHISSARESIANVAMFDLLGKKVYSQKGINSTVFQSEFLPFSNQIYIVRITLSDESVVTEKKVR